MRNPIANVWLALPALALFGAGCGAPSPSASHDPPEAAAAGSLAATAPPVSAALAPVPGRVVVKLDRAAASVLRDALAASRLPAEASAFPAEIAALNTETKLRAVRPMFDPSASDDALRAHIARLAETGRPLDPGAALPHLEDVFLFDFDAQIASTHAALDYARLPHVVYAEALFPVTLALTPADPLYPSQWALRNVINAEAAWDFAGGAGQTIAIVDSGFDGTHPDLAAKVDPASYDACTGVVVNPPVDNTGHGTSVAGIAGALWDHTGIAGMAPDAGLLSVNTVSSGVPDPACVPGAIAYAAAHAGIINASFTMHATSLVIEDAVRAAHAADAVFIAASGNDTSLAMATPANVEWAITVGAVDSADQVATYSNRGIKLDVVAPGGDGSLPPQSGILSTAPGVSWQSTFGTSMAAPHVAGLVALMRELAPMWTVEQIRSALRKNAADVNVGSLPGFDIEAGFGRIDAEASAHAAAGGTPLPEANLTSPKVDQHIRGKTKIMGYANVPAGSPGQYIVEEAATLAGPFVPLAGVAGSFVGTASSSPVQLGIVAPSSFQATGTRVMRLTTTNLASGDESVDYDEIEVCGPSVATPPGAVAWWKFDRASWPLAIDHAGANTGTYQGAAAPGPNGYVTDGAGFFGSLGDAMVAPAVSPPLFYYMTVAAWIRTGVPNATGIVASYHPAPGDGWELFVDNGNYFFTTNMQGGVQQVIGFAGTSSPYTWEHIAVVVDAVTPGVLAPLKVSLYKNGTLTSSTLFTAPSSYVPPPQASAAYRVGGGPSLSPNLPAEAPFPGNIDEVQVFKGPLTQARIQATVAAGCGGNG